MVKKSILTMDQFHSKEIYDILKDAKLFSNSFKDWQLSRKRMAANLFFEPSTRTHYSFSSAQLQLGIKIVDFYPEQSSQTKGETLYDTVKTFQMLGYDLCVIRHWQDNYFEELKNIDIHLINAGDGKANHPSQSLLDLYTIYDEFGTFENKNLLIIGDIKHSRVAHSNSTTFERLGGNVKVSGPLELMDENDKRYIALDEGIKWADIVMLLRIQFERDDELAKLNKNEYLEKYGLTKNRYNLLKDNAIIMHPAPVNRGLEIDTDLVEAPKSRIFKQMENGVYIRKAMIKNVFDEEF